MASTTTDKPFKADLLRKSPSVQALREEIRKQFKNRLKINRSNDLCRRRELLNVVSSVTNQYQKIKKELMNEVDDINPDDMSRIMADVEKELLDTVIPDEIDPDVFIDDILKNFTNCTICNAIIRNKDVICVICDNCTKLYFSSHF
ncbi:hypothetical protein FQR65_LT01609 [Abscondita terminalis]|nr:hypothetical protein FQR65_LT01609 [Abscondita terminalis]